MTVADALAIQQHVAGNVPITSPYKQVAADVNKSNSITGFDATIINQSLLGNPSALNQFKTSWRFVPVSYAMSVPPWGFRRRSTGRGEREYTDQDFWGIKTGDVVDVYADPANLVPPPPLVLRG
ncbi:MAG: dockerin type I domain-containing protein [Saprospiraceae bacterium]